MLRRGHLDKIRVVGSAVSSVRAVGGAEPKPRGRRAGLVMDHVDDEKRARERVEGGHRLASRRLAGARRNDIEWRVATENV